jgi:arylsulfatase A-like enzyme
MNLVLICADDLGAHDLGCTGSTFYETPILDQLAAEGRTFTRAYAGSPMCSPSRAALLTGCAPARLGLTNWIGAPGTSGPLDAVGFVDGLPDRRTLPQALVDHGVQTWHVGKWHLGSGDAAPQRRGFQQVRLAANVGGPTRYFAPYLTPGLPNRLGGEYLIDHVTDEAIELLRSRDRSRPFFLNLWHYGVHTPIQAPGHLVAKYVRKRRELGLGPSASGLEDLSWSSRLGFGKLAEAPLMRRHRQSDPVFAAMVEALDASIGRFLQALEDEGTADDTLVAFTSDNGGVASAWHLVPPGCNAPLAEGKGFTHEGGVRVPLLVRWPGRVEEGSVDPRPAIGMDLMPTMLAAAGAPLEPEAHRDGIDLLDHAAPDRDLAWHYPHYQGHGGRPTSAIRSGRWKLIVAHEQAAPALFDVEADPGETADRAGEHPAEAAALGARLERWLHEVEAERPRADPSWAHRQQRRGAWRRWAADGWSASVRRRHERRVQRWARR